MMRLAKIKIPLPMGNKKSPYFKKEIKTPATRILKNILTNEFTVK